MYFSTPFIDLCELRVACKCRLTYRDPFSLVCPSVRPSHFTRYLLDSFIWKLQVFFGKLFVMCGGGENWSCRARSAHVSSAAVEDDERTPLDKNWRFRQTVVSITGTSRAYRSVDYFW